LKNITSTGVVVAFYDAVVALLSPDLELEERCDNERDNEGDSDARTRETVSYE